LIDIHVFLKQALELQYCLNLDAVSMFRSALWPGRLRGLGEFRKPPKRTSMNSAAQISDPRIDGLQYANWSEKIFRQMRTGGVDAVHVTITYHETFRETVLNISRWNHYFEMFPDLVMQGRTADDIRRARDTGRTAIFFGAQNPSCIEDDIGLVEVLHTLGLRFMQLTYNNQSLLASGCYEARDTGLTRMGRAVVAEMNRVGLVIDMSHSGERSTLEAIEASNRPITITHANPSSWHPALRNKSDAVLRALAESGGMLGFSLYPHHLAQGSDCSLRDFCEMIARTADMIGSERLAIGSDLCQDQPDSVVSWMRNGRWTKDTDFGEGSADIPGFPPQPNWFRDNRDFANIASGLGEVGMSPAEITGILGANWLRFFAENFGPMASATTGQYNVPARSSARA
jgi:microsomal dipeptidase-like Zn-dependent dipeptidase